MYDIAIIGAGICGCFIARELSRYELKTVVFEKDYDVSNGTTKANSAIVHSGYDAKPGTLKAKLNVQGNRLFDEVCHQLDVPLRRIGSLTIAIDEDDMKCLEKLLRQGEANNVPGLRIITRDEIRRIEPNINDAVIAALYAPTAGIVDSFGLAIALAENAVDNGVEFRLENQVVSIERFDDCYKIGTNKGDVQAKTIINCAGVFAKEINDMLTPARFTIKPRKGEYIIFDKNVGNLVNHTIFQCPTEKGKGVLVSPTTHGNLLVGPDSQDITDKYDVSTSSHGLKEICKTAALSVKNIPVGMAITNFAGLRATPNTQDFVIEELEGFKGFVNVAGIESPGLASSPAIALYVVGILHEIGTKLTPKAEFNPQRKPLVRFACLSDEKKAELTAQNRLYGRIVCRCEDITEGEIVDAIHRNVGARSVDGVRRRVRTGMGRCQGGFCSPRVMEILARELSVDIADVVKENSSSYILTSKTKMGE